MSSLIFIIIILIGVAIFLLAVILFFFEPGLAYRIRKIPSIPEKRKSFHAFSARLPAPLSRRGTV